MNPPPEKVYTINEIFYSIQGEGMRVGQPSLFIRFAYCNLRCSIDKGPLSPGGFDCDTEFTSGRKFTAAQIVHECSNALDRLGSIKSPPRWIVLTGGEPGLQIDNALLFSLKSKGFSIAIETNGSVNLDDCSLLDWITVSPKVAEHAIRQRTATEVKYVRSYGQALPDTVVVANHYLVSPAFNGNEVDPAAFSWVRMLVLQNPKWRLSPQMHKLWRVQ